MANTLKLMAVLAHPDDESLGAGGVLAKYAASQFTTAAIIEAASPDSLYYRDLAPHRVAKLYYMAPTKDLLDVYQFVFGDLVMHIDGVARRGAGWPDWQITTLIDTWAYWRTVWKAVCCPCLLLREDGTIKKI